MKLNQNLKLLIKLTFNFRVPGEYAKVRKDDIFLVSYPKSGNTWLRFLFGNILYPSGVDFRTIDKLIPDIYVSTKRQIDSLASPRIIKSHEPYVKKLPKVIYIYRDPRDVVISYFYWYKKFRNTEFSNFNDFFDAFIDGNIAFGLWSEHVKGWLSNAERFPHKIMTVKYEDLKSDTFTHFKRILSFCNIDATDEQILNAVSNSDFKIMKEMEKRQEKSSFLKKTDLNIKFVRAEKSEWEEILSDEQIEKINETFEPYLKEFKKS